MAYGAWAAVSRFFANRQPYGQGLDSLFRNRLSTERNSAGAPEDL